MDQVEKLLDEVYAGRERLTRDEIHHHAVAVGASAEVVDAVEALPEGEYAYDEASEAIAQLGTRDTGSSSPTGGVPAEELDDADLSRELRHLHETRDDTFRHGAPQAVLNHDKRTEELEAEYLRRFPDRAVDPRRLRPAETPD
ncbi:DUF2795 domain-containing protein [Dactylosporangium vinaceum]|uniref:DUF6158 family protein n=1 Tax=Dactylosporangium vinaceum TaxID=53362 RepID=A0ABV5MA89_9ACTN|nr:DUF6158 family protein [Dactylosporangium vinaceum]UAB93047.1 DUF2795 domain-containing protein [Dactylosporangium vinaceum]